MTSLIEFLKEQIHLCKEKIRDDEEYIKSIELRIDMRKIELDNLKGNLITLEKSQ